MGNCATNCSNCMGKEGEHAEFNMDPQQNAVMRYGNTPDDGARGLGGPSKDYNKLLQQNYRMIVKLQAFWRGYTARRLISLLKAKQLGSSKYFTQEEAKETITKNIYNPNQPREKRPAYTFRTGAVYTGEWKGGFRDGFGEQVWTDSA